MKTVPTIFLDQVAARGEEISIWVKEGGEFKSRTWNEVLYDVRQFVGNLLRLGVQQGDRVVQFSENRYEWILADLAFHILGAVHVPVHSTLSGAQVVEQADDSGANILLVSRQDLFDKLAASSVPLPLRIRVLSYEPVSGELNGTGVERFQQEINTAAAIALESTAAERILPDTYATILYTSGTTGEPKGVILDQRNIVTNSTGANDSIGQTADDVRLNFLPLSHIFARTCDLYSWLLGGAQLALAESRETVIPDCQAIKPTVINAVPYFYARLQKALTEKGAADAPDALKNLLGGRVRFCCSGGAPLTLPLFDYFQSQKLPLYQGYGLTESSPVISTSSFDHNRRGAVGRAIEDVEVKIADDGEILTRGPHVMVGYWQNEAATNDAIRDGWLHTGDLGRVDEDGFIYVTGRKKELIVTATGKNVAPAYLEALLVEDPLIAQAIVIGDDRKFLTAVIVPDTNGLKRALGVEDLPDLNGDVIQAAIATNISKRLAEVAKNEQIGKFTVIARPFTSEAGELTAKLSLRRKVIEANFAAEIDAMYQ